MSVNIKIDLDYNQVKNIINQLDENEQNRLAEYLDELTLYRRWDKLQEKLKDIPLSPEEIQEEVEIVRTKRYET